MQVPKCGNQGVLQYIFRVGITGTTRQQKAQQPLPVRTHEIRERIRGPRFRSVNQFEFVIHLVSEQQHPGPGPAKY